MAPRRPLDDLSLIAVFKQLTPDNQLKAAAMSPRCTALVRAANRRVRTLIIAKLYEDVERRPGIMLNHFSLKTKHSLQMVKDSRRGDQGTSPNYPINDCLSKWRCLQLNLIGDLDSSSIAEQIVNAFSALTDLRFIMIGGNNRPCLNLNPHIKLMIALLSHTPWTKQLTRFMLSDSHRITDKLANCLFTAINGLTALQHLAFDWENFAFIPKLPLLEQLKTVQLTLKCHEDKAEHFFCSLETAVTTNVNLRIFLYSLLRNEDFYEDFYEDVFFFSETLPLFYRHIVGFSAKNVKNSTVLYKLKLFSSLRYLHVFSLKPSQIGPLLTALSQLKRLIFLQLFIDFQNLEENHPEEVLSLPPRPLAQLSSLKALDLTLFNTSHSQVAWLNLQQTMPNLTSIRLPSFACKSCHKTPPETNIAYNFECLSALLANLHLGVSNQLIFLDKTTADKVLLALS